MQIVLGWHQLQQGPMTDWAPWKLLSWRLWPFDKKLQPWVLLMRRLKGYERRRSEVGCLLQKWVRKTGSSPLYLEKWIRQQDKPKAWEKKVERLEGNSMNQKSGYVSTKKVFTLMRRHKEKEGESDWVDLWSPRKHEGRTYFRSLTGFSSLSEGGPAGTTNK
jgi:hypothetical protein